MYVIDSMAPLSKDELDKGVYIKRGNDFYPITSEGTTYGNIFISLLSDNSMGIPELRRGDQLVYKYRVFFDESYVTPVRNTVYSLAGTYHIVWDTKEPLLRYFRLNSALNRAHFSQYMIRNGVYESIQVDEINGSNVLGLENSNKLVKIGDNDYLIKAEPNSDITLGNTYGTDYQEISIKADTAFYLLDEGYFSTSRYSCSSTREGYAIINYSDFSEGGLHFVNCGNEESPFGLINVISDSEPSDSTKSESNSSSNSSNSSSNGLDSESSTS